MKGKFVIIILVIIAIILYTSNDYDVYGFWVASEQFLKDANLKSMVLFIDEKGSPRNGYLYVTKNFVKYKTTSILLHKDGVPKSLIKKLGL